MSRRADYSVEEWEAIRRTPAEVVVAIEQASGSGWYGRRQERKATMRAFHEVIAEHGDQPIVADIVAAKDQEGVLVDALRSGGEPMIDAALESAARARRALQAKGSPGELDAYAISVLDIAEQVAASGGSRDGSKYSDAEQLLLRRVAEALGRADYEPPSDRTRGLGRYEPGI